MRIVTDSKRPEDSKNPDDCNVFAIYQHIANSNDVHMMRERYINGGVAYGEIKQELYERLDEQFSEARERYHALIQLPHQIDEVLDEGAQKASRIAQDNLNHIRSAVGVKVR